MLFKNLATEEQVNVSNLTLKNGRIFFSVRGKGCGQRFFNRNTCLVLDEEAEDGTYLKCADGWEVIKKRNTENSTKPQSVSQSATADEEAENVEPAEVVENVTNNTPEEDSNEQALIAAIKNLRGGAVDMAKVRQIVAEELAKIQPQAKEIAVVTIDGTETGRVETPHKLLPKVLSWVKNDRVNKRQPWLFGPAGSGKSTIAEQVAKALNLPLYIYTNVQQKYEIEGFIGADGKFAETPMYKAMVHGGIVLCDEMGTWLPEPATAFNTITANRRYTFPGVGTVEAHPDFHIIAADNTTGRGGSRKYSARYKLDASTLDRFKFLEVPYTDEHDLFMAQGDVELVEFAKDMRRVLDEAQSEYECTPRALLDIATGMKIEENEKDALYYGLCSGWNKQDIRTFAARLTCRNKYGRLFNEIADNL